MLKRIAYSILAAVIFAIGATGAVFAAEDEQTGLVKVRGEVTEVDPTAGKFRIADPDGVVQTFFVDESTRFQGQLEGLEEMQVGWKAAVGAEEEDGKLIARVVIAGQPAQLLRYRGEITQIDAAAGKFRLMDGDGAVQTFFSGENTRYGGQAGELADLQLGWKAGVAAKEGQDGSLQAVVVIAGMPNDLRKVRGEVTEVDPAAGKFRIQSPDGSVETFFVDEKTRYQGQLEDLEGLLVGWHAGVAAAEEEGKLIARLVIAGNPKERLRLRGTVTQVDPEAGKLRIEASSGDVTTLFTDENTKFRGRIQDLADLEVGTRAGALAIEQEDGSYLARLVVAGKLRPERGPGEGQPPAETNPGDISVPGYGL